MILIYGFLAFFLSGFFAFAQQTPLPEVEAFFRMCTPVGPFDRSTYEKVILEAYAGDWKPLANERSYFDPSSTTWHRSWGFMASLSDTISAPLSVEIAARADRTVERCEVGFSSLGVDAVQENLVGVPSMDLLSDDDVGGLRNLSYAYLESDRQSLYVTVLEEVIGGQHYTVLGLTRSIEYGP